MSHQVSAQGFDLTDALREACLQEAQTKLQPLCNHMIQTRWALSLAKNGKKIAHLTWKDGMLAGDATVETENMYESIHLCAKKALEQIKKQHTKRLHDKRGAGALPVSSILVNES